MSMETYGNDTDQHVQADIFDTDSNLDKARNSKQTTARLCAYPIRQKRRLLAVLLCTIGSALFAILAPKVCGIAIVGPTGVGKTTPVNLLMRCYDIQSGHITIDGTDITAMRRNDVRSLMGMVLQGTCSSAAPYVRASHMAASMRLTRRSRLRRKPREPTISSAHCPKDTTPCSTRKPPAYRRGNGTLAMHHGTLFPNTDETE